MAGTPHAHAHPGQLEGNAKHGIILGNLRWHLAAGSSPGCVGMGLVFPAQGGEGEGHLTPPHTGVHTGSWQDAEASDSVAWCPCWLYRWLQLQDSGAQGGEGGAQAGGPADPQGRALTGSVIKQGAATHRADRRRPARRTVGPFAPRRRRGREMSTHPGRCWDRKSVV